jgi:hypothetical protein
MDRLALKRSGADPSPRIMSMVKKQSIMSMVKKQSIMLGFRMAHS